MARAAPGLPSLLRRVSWPSLRAQAGRQLLALVAVALGVALAYAVHLIHATALAEFDAAVRQAHGEPDLILRGPGPDFEESVYAELAAAPGVAEALPRLDRTVALHAEGRPPVTLQLVGLDALRLGGLAPGLRPLPDPAWPSGADQPLPFLDPGALFLNEAAWARLAGGPQVGEAVELRLGGSALRLRLAGRVAAGGPPLAVLDLAGAQRLGPALGRLGRVELRLAPGQDPQAFRAAWQAGRPDGEGLRLETPQEGGQALANLSRAYRANLSALAAVALFTGAFLVHAVLALAVAERRPQLALLGVLGLDAAARRRLVLAECAALGVVGAGLGLLLGTGLAAAALRLLGGDLGGGALGLGAGPTAPLGAAALRLDALPALAHGALGLAAALLGGLGPARAAERLAPAQALKGLDAVELQAPGPWRRAAAPGLLALGALLCAAPPLGGLPVGAYLGIALGLAGGILAVPALARRLPDPARWTRHPRLMLALARAGRQAGQATLPVAGVVASLALSVALTVMVSSFRGAVAEWLDDVLPAELYLRARGPGGPAAALPAGFPEAVAALPGVARVEALHASPLQLEAGAPPISLLAKPLGPQAAQRLPLIGPAWAGRAPEPAVWASEAAARRLGLAPGDRLTLPLPGADGRVRTVALRLHGVWRDYARQHGALMLDREDFLALGGPPTVHDLAVWTAEGAEPADLDAALDALAAAQQPPLDLERQRADALRALSLRIFDRSFLVTQGLQAVALGIGLFGLAASLAAQVLARRREFGLLAHLGFTRRGLLGLVVAEGLLWTAVGVALGLVLGLAVAAVLVLVVNPQSFHWTLPLDPPPGRLAAMALAVLAAGAAAAAAAGRRALGASPVRAVREDA